MEYTAPPPGDQPPVTANVIGAGPRHAPPPPPKPGRGGLLLALFVLLLGGAFVVVLGLIAVAFSFGPHNLDGIEEAHYARQRRARDKVAILRVEGVIASGEGYLKKQIDAIRDDPHVKAIVLRINSPGGTVSGSDYTYHHLTELRDERQLPIVVSMGAICASGGYYIAMAVGDTPEVIYAEPTTWTGSIGVIIPHYDAAGLLEEWKITDDSIKSNPLKQLGSFTRHMTDREREILQSLVNDSFARFKKIVRSGRPAFEENPKALDDVATGVVFSTPQALKNGLVDRSGFLEDAIDRAAELAGLDKDKVNVVEYKQRLGLLEHMIMQSETPPARADLQSLLRLATPQAYYLYSWLPTLQRTAR